jgi:hypothetical protein
VGAARNADFLSWAHGLEANGALACGIGVAHGGGSVILNSRHGCCVCWLRQSLWFG